MLPSILSPTHFSPSGTRLPKSASVLGKVKFFDTAADSLENCSLAILGVCEDRNSLVKGASGSPDAIRKYLYSLSAFPIKGNILDLGNIANTHSPSDTYAALRMVVEIVLERGLTLIVLGGNQELTLPIYNALTQNEKSVSLAVIDSRIDLEPENADFSPNCFLNNIFSESQTNLNCLNLIGFQNYLTSAEAIKALEANHHELYRLGYLRNSIHEVEPAFRNSQLTSFDLSSIRQSDCPASSYPSPNGLYAEEACQLSRYAGLSERMKAFAVFEHNVVADSSEQSAHLAAQMVWHFIEGFYSRKKVGKSLQNRKFKRFFIKSPIPNINMIFLKDIVTQNWWMEFPRNSETGDDTIIVACSQSDYLAASKGDVPERWLRASQRVI